MIISYSISVRATWVFPTLSPVASLQTLSQMMEDLHTLQLVEFRVFEIRLVEFGLFEVRLVGFKLFESCPIVE